MSAAFRLAMELNEENSILVKRVSTLTKKMPTSVVSILPGMPITTMWFFCLLTIKGVMLLIACFSFSASISSNPSSTSSSSASASSVFCVKATTSSKHSSTEQANVFEIASVLAFSSARVDEPQIVRATSVIDPQPHKRKAKTISRYVVNVFFMMRYYTKCNPLCLAK